MLILGCLTPTDSDTNNSEELPEEFETTDEPVELFTCDLLADLATFKSKQQYPDSYLETITDLTTTVKTSTVLECEGYGEFNNGRFVIVVLWAIENDEGVEYGYETKPIE